MNWDLASFFAEFNGAEMVSFKQRLARDIGALCEKAATLPPLSSENQDAWEEVFCAYEDIQRRLSHLGSYISCLASADSRNEAYLKESASLAVVRAEFSKIRVQLLRALKDCAAETFALFADRPRLRGAGHFLARLREDSRRSMDAEKENLAHELAVDGIQAWGRLYDRVSGKLEFDMEFPDGGRQRLPMSQRRSLLENPDRRIRKAAFDGGNAAWSSVEDVAAAALNAIAGARLTLNRHRGVSDFLEVALFQSAITRRTLDAMFEAVFANLELPRRICRLKARAMGRDRVAWYDLAAPLAVADQERIPWEQATAMVASCFARAYPRLGDFFREMVRRNWIEWEPRPGKRPGAFCTGSLLTNEARIFMTYDGSFGDAVTLAHESGHAYHGELMRDLRPFARAYPMTLAETASTFAELVFLEGALRDAGAGDARQCFLLDMELGHAAVYLLDIPVRFAFEKALYEERGGGELGVSRLKELMVETQRRILGDALETGGEDPYFWASKLHFYITGTTFYNFPYTLGFLLSRALFSMFRKEGSAFLPKYENFLRLSGSDTVENVARQSLGRDLESAGFWSEAIASLEEPLARLEELLPGVAPASRAASHRGQADAANV
ncbi:MAG TPA: M3 family oligoendopeptidase [Candidatus Acidoferrales bacterium]|nr:M3 family oligoendopeptidase [Candidatus Acidoferrales bacterium]